MRTSLSLSTRLVGAALVWLALMLSAGGIVLSTAFRSSVEHGQFERLMALLNAMTASIDIAADGRVTLAQPLGEPRFDQVFSGWYWQVSDSSGPVARSRSLWDEAIPADLGPPSARPAQRTAPGPEGTSLLVVERDLVFPGHDGPLHVLVALDRRRIEGEVGRFSLLLGAALGTLGLGLLLAIVAQVRFGLRPLRMLTQALEAVRTGTSRRIEGEHPAEVAPLVTALNSVLDHDSELIERARTHVGNLAHGLKTPLAVLKAEAAHNPVVAEQIEAMDRLVSHHLARAAAAARSGRALGARTRINPVAGGIRDALIRIHADKGLEIELVLEGAPLFPGEEEDLAEILGNLMDNACKWARRRVRVSGLDRGLVVEDDGPGMTPEQAAEASRRGARFDEMTPGFGLGLSIVADLVALHGGRMTFERSPDLGGLRVEVRF